MPHRTPADRGTTAAHGGTAKTGDNTSTSDSTGVAEWPVALAAVVLLAAGVAAAGTAAALPAAGAATTLPTAELAVEPNPAEPGETVTFDASASTADNGVDRCDFDVDGDGTYEFSESDCVGTWTYETVGDYNASVRVVAGDRTDTTARVVTVSEPPTVELGYEPVAPAPGETVTFDAAADDPDGQVVGYTWSVDGEVVAETDVGTLERPFASAGTYLVRVAVEDDAGHVVVREVEVTVGATPTPATANEPPTVDVGVGREAPTVGQAVAFEVAVDDPDGTVAAVTWLVDGEAVAEGTAFEWAFNAPGTHEVTAVVTDDDGASARETVVVEVAPSTDEPTTEPDGPWPQVPLPGPLLIGGGVLVVGLGAARLLGADGWGGDGGPDAGDAGTDTGESGGGTTDAGDGTAAGRTARRAGRAPGRADGAQGRSEGEGQDQPDDRGDLEEELREQVEEEAEEKLEEELEDRLEERLGDDEAVVVVRDGAFDPVRLSVPTGTEVRWVNADDEYHGVDPVRFHDAAAAWSFGTAAVEPAGEATHRFEGAGVYEYHCTACGEGMCGVVVVGDAELAAPLPCEGER